MIHFSLLKQRLLEVTHREWRFAIEMSFKFFDDTAVLFGICSDEQSQESPRIIGCFDRLGERSCGEALSAKSIPFEKFGSQKSYSKNQEAP